jgi:hypothetical protein
LALTVTQLAQTGARLAESGSRLVAPRSIPVAPLRPVDPWRLVSGVNSEPPLKRVEYERLFNLPAIPTLTFRMEY